MTSGDLDNAFTFDGKLDVLDEKDLNLDMIEPQTSLQNPTTSNSSDNLRTSDSNTITDKQKKKILINPSTGDLEEMGSDVSDTEVENSGFNIDFNSEMSNSLYSDDETSCSTTGFSKITSDVSDTEKSNLSECTNFSVGLSKSKTKTKKSKVKDGNKVNRKSSGKDKEKVILKSLSSKEKDRPNRDKSMKSKPKIKLLKTSIIQGDNADNSNNCQEKITLRLKLERSCSNFYPMEERVFNQTENVSTENLLDHTQSNSTNVKKTIQQSQIGLTTNVSSTITDSSNMTYTQPMDYLSSSADQELAIRKNDNLFATENDNLSVHQLPTNSNSGDLIKYALVFSLYDLKRSTIKLLFSHICFGLMF